MTNRHLHLLSTLLCCLALVVCSCSDDDQDQADGGAPIAKDCEKKCTQQESHFCVTGPRKVCVECVTSYHCQSNPGAMGNKCTSTNLCTCGSDADCKGKTHGTTCDKKLQICSCSTDADCPSPGKCTGEMYGAKVCKNQCYKDSDCTDDEKPFCDAAKGACVACKTDTDCAAGTSWGNKCLKGASYTACGCSTDADCAGNKNGTSCNTATRRCSCAKDADCKKAPYTKCSPVSKGSYALRCQKPCKSDMDCGANLNCHKATGKCTECSADKDCTNPSYKKCDLTLGKCVACQKNADCTDKTKPFCYPSSGVCVECLTDATCKAGSFWGNKCVKGTYGTASCRCTANSHCAGNKNGATCNTTARRCTCKSATECKKAPYTRCYLGSSYATYLHCQKPCTTNSGCGWGLKCDKASGMCLQCKVDKDCTGSVNKFCHQAMGKCVACRNSKDCTSSARPTCDTGSGRCVECMADKDCKAGFFYGNKCITSSTSGKVCRCQSSAHCVGNPRGPKCLSYYGMCTCSADKDCKAPYTACAKPYPSSSYKYCQKPCKTNADCTSAYSPFCKASSGKCVGCLTNDQCTNGYQPVCDTKAGTCAGCKSDKDCAASMFGGSCNKSTGRCGCSADKDCAGARAWGKKCAGYGSSKRCQCQAAADCKGNSNGSTCNTYYRRCTCAANKDCTTAPYTSCYQPSSTAQYSHCQKPCKTNADCTLPGLTKCFLGKCIAS